MNAKRKAFIALDEVKQRHTSHWDEDLLSREDLDKLHVDGQAERRRYKRRQFAWIGFWLGLLCLYPTLIHWGGRLIDAVF